MNKVFRLTGLALLTAPMIGLTFLSQATFAAEPFQPIASALAPSPPIEQGDDPDMDGREGVPPNSVGSGTR
jgi:hypothetical protein